MPINSDILKNYINPVYIETGSFLGDSIKSALEAGFNKIYSIELSKKLYETCKKRFESEPKVNLICGDAAKELYNVTLRIYVNTTYFIDAHFSAGDTEGEGYDPLEDEIKVIKDCNHPGDIILIDDIRGCDYEKLISLFPGKEIELIDSPLFLKDIMVVRL